MKNTLLLVMMLISNWNYAQTKSKYENLDLKIKEIEILFNQKNNNLLADYFCPKMVNYVGGKDSVAVVLNEISAVIETNKITRYKFSFGKHSKIVQSDDELQCTIPLITELENNEFVVVTEAALLLFSNDDGKSWCLAFPPDDEDLEYNELLNLSKKIVIPEIKQKVTDKK
ncbi:hypothetical protein [Flavobacterium reichenbachii]|uniref:DUF4878 domain-containing protein n=1 Tax=Flavobacterium reichenbachii TaxID=362418 RepID=A0A085ZGH8_9FLAO|nr:hypothetical protein [Flavobacterium reichenbachii]KFF03542.1 hypothetical protein IW19_21945 [Flavobacterium reichenbachii]OXB15640.1 hypothetical protein B0A68_09600 [Flavobacterium reichenbachii]